MKFTLIVFSILIVVQLARGEGQNLDFDDDSLPVDMNMDQGEIKKVITSHERTKKLPFCKKLVITGTPVCITRHGGACFCLANKK